MRADGVLRVGDGHDASAAHQPDRGLDANDAVGVRRAHDAAVGLGADGDCGAVRRGRGAGARAGATGVAVDGVGVVALPAAARPAAGGREAAKVGPLAQGGLAENDGAGGAQLGGHRGVTGRRRSYQAQRTGSRLHAVPGIDVVFEHDGDAVQWTAHTSGSALRVQLQRDGLSIRIDFDDRVYFGSLLIERGDARLIEVHQGDRVQLARSHGRLQIGDGGFGRVARGRDLRPRRADGPPAGEGRGGSRERTQLKEVSPT